MIRATNDDRYTSLRPVSLVTHTMCCLIVLQHLKRDKSFFLPTLCALCSLPFNPIEVSWAMMAAILRCPCPPFFLSRPHCYGRSLCVASKPNVTGLCRCAARAQKSAQLAFRARFSLSLSPCRGIDFTFLLTRKEKTVYRDEREARCLAFSTCTRAVSHPMRLCARTTRALCRRLFATFVAIGPVPANIGNS